MTRSRARHAVVVSHTHWDREWYLSVNRFRVRLIDVVERVLDALEREAAFACFMLDGQTVILEDYLTLRPGQEARIRTLVQSGRLIIGPWYVLPDEFLVSGEVHVRNLLMGHAVAARFGAAQQVGYMPDSFGHIAQMPQLLRLGGMDAFIYTRGDGDAIEHLGLQYRWQSPDGSEVLAVSQFGGYCRAGGLGYAETWEAHTTRVPELDLAVAQVGAILEEAAAHGAVDVALISNGCDHLPPQRRLAEILDAVRAAFPETSFTHGTLADYVRAVRDSARPLKSHAGELLGGKRELILSGVWSARMYLKQANDRAQTSLTAWLEPVAAALHFLHGRPYPGDVIDWTWQTLLRAHPHDSICGCSIDEVHRDMEPRFRAVIETAEETLARGLGSLLSTFAPRREGDAETAVCVMNPAPLERTDVVERLVVLQQPGIDPARIAVVDQSGRPVPAVVVRSEHVARFWGADYRTMLAGDDQRRRFERSCETLGPWMRCGQAGTADSDQMLLVQFAATLPALGHATFRIREGTVVAGSPPPLAVANDTLENDHVRVTLHQDGSIDLVHKPSGAIYEGLNRLTDTEDAGDEYDYSPAPESSTVTSAGVAGTVRLLDDSGLRARLHARFGVHLPTGLSTDRRRRAADTVECPVTVEVRLTRDSPIVDLHVTVDNRARDHRLRAVFPVDVLTDTIVSDGHFVIQRRALVPPVGEGWVQPHPGTYPQQDFSLLEGAGRGLAVFNRGLPEVAPLPPAEGPGLALTLLRAVGWLSRDDLPTRKFHNAGPTVETPDAQCQGPARYRYALMPYAGDHISAGVKRHSTLWRTEVIAVQGVADGAVPGGRSLVRHDGRTTAVTAIKRHRQRDALVVRWYNITDRRVRETLTFDRRVAAAWRVDLLEERLSAVDHDGSETVGIALGPHEIVSLEVVLAPR